MAIDPRYLQLNDIIDEHKPKVIVEVGTWNGERAIQMTSRALSYHDHVDYYGFDMFEDGTRAMDTIEMNAKPRNRVGDVLSRLQRAKTELAKRGKSVEYTLTRGNTRKTLPMLAPEHPARTADLAFIDGGHTVKTIENDYENLKNCKVIVFDDYHEGDGPSTEVYWANKTVERTGATVLPAETRCKDGGVVKMAVLVS